MQDDTTRAATLALSIARLFLNDKTHWYTGGRYFKDKNCLPWDIGPLDLPGIQACCLLGAVGVGLATQGRAIERHKIEAFEKARLALITTARDMDILGGQGHPFLSLTKWNDEVASHEQVLAMLDNAREILETTEVLP